MPPKRKATSPLQKHIFCTTTTKNVGKHHQLKEHKPKTLDDEGWICKIIIWHTQEVYEGEGNRGRSSDCRGGGIITSIPASRMAWDILLISLLFIREAIN